MNRESCVRDMLVGAGVHKEDFGDGCALWIGRVKHDRHVYITDFFGGTDFETDTVVVRFCMDEGEELECWILDDAMSLGEQMRDAIRLVECLREEE